MNEIEVPTNTQHVAAMVSGHASSRSQSVSKTISYRAPVFLIGAIDAMAQKSGKSRNAMMGLLLQVGIDEVRRELDPEVAQSLRVSEAKVMLDLLEAGDVENLDE
jgi:hypothetical protein